MTLLQELLLIEAIERLFIETTYRLSVNLASHFSMDERPVSALTWRQEKAAELMAVTQESARIIANGTKAAPETLIAVMNEIIKANPVELPPGIQPRSERTVETLAALAVRAQDSYNITNTTMLESTVGAYTQAVQAGEMVLNQTATETALGFSQMPANRAAVGKLAEIGITGFVDAAGRNWTPEAYVNMVTRTTVHNAQVQMQFSRMEDYGQHVFQVSSHMGARPLCEPYQGKFYSDNGTSGTVFDLDGNGYHFEPLEATSFGEPAGLFGINCRHRPILFFNGLSRPHAEPTETEQEKEKNRAEYERTQEMRSQERRIRATREKAAMYAAANDADTAAEWKKQARREYTDYREWCEDHGMTPRPDRTYIGGRNTQSQFPPGR